MYPLKDKAITDLWSLVDAEKLQAEYRVNKDMVSLQHMTLKELQSFFIQYRFFTQYYIQDLALLVAKLPFGSLRTLLADILSEELGEGQASHAHPQLYDNFLISLGLTQETIDKTNTLYMQELERVQKLLIQEDWSVGVGLRGMGGECLCQIYLASVHWHFIKNPAIIAMNDQVDWVFWDIHTGEADEEHRRLTQEAINQLLFENPQYTAVLEKSYLISKRSWDYLWKICFDNALSTRTLQMSLV